MISWLDLVILLWTENASFSGNKCLRPRQRQILTQLLIIAAFLYNHLQCLTALVGFIAFSHEIWNKAMVHRGCQTAGAGWGTTLVLLARPGGGCCRNEGCTSWKRSRWPDTAVSASREAYPVQISAKQGAPSAITNNPKWSQSQGMHCLLSSCFPSQQAIIIITQLSQPPLV